MTGPETTASLLAKMRAGDDDARTRLVVRYLVILRRGVAGPDREGLTADLCDDRPSPLEQAIGAQAIDRYERALVALTEHQRQAVVLRVGMGLTYREAAEAMGGASEDAVRMLVTRATALLSELMADHARR